jgi:hypothetical protein
VVLGGVLAGGVAAGVISGAVLGQSGNLVNIFMNSRTLAKVRLEDGEVLKLKRRDLNATRLELTEGGWDLVLPKRREEHRFTGEEARRVASVVVSRINRSGAGKRDVQEAVALLDMLGAPDAVIRAAAREEVKYRRMRGHRRGNVAGAPTPTRLAVEMALHEEEERRALEGELWLLERRWKEAEEIAAISDDLLLPEGTDEFLARNRGEREG